MQDMIRTVAVLAAVFILYWSANIAAYAELWPGPQAEVFV